MRNFLKRVFNKITLKGYRDQYLFEQKKQEAQLEIIRQQVFTNNPVMIVGKVKMYLPLFYVDHIQKIIFNTRNFYEIETLDFLKLHYKKFESVIDIGTNIGNHMLYWASELGAKKITCFEPNDFNRAILEKNIELNYLQPIVTFHSCALGAESGKGIQKNFTLDNTGMNRIDITDDPATGSGIDIKKLDDFNISPVDFIKIDVEGFEAAVLKGAADTISKNKPVIMIEVFDSNRQEVEAIMQGYQYKKFITLEEYNTIFIPA